MEDYLKHLELLNFRKEKEKGENNIDTVTAFNNIDTVTAFGRKRNFLQNMWLLLHEILESYMTYY